MVSDPFQLQHPFFGMLSQVGFENIQNFLYPLLRKNLKHIYFKVTRRCYFVRVPSYFETLWYPHLYFDRGSNI